MKNRLLLPVAVLTEPSPGSVERILARDFWGGIGREGAGEVICLSLGPKAPSAGGSERTTSPPAARNR